MTKNKPQNITEFLSVNNLHILQKILHRKKRAITFTSYLLMLFKKIWGFEAGFRIPSLFWGRDFELWEGIITAEKLRQSGFIKHWSPLPLKNIYPDEPKLIRYSIENKEDGRGKSYGSGFDFFSQENALWGSIGESIERYALNSFNPTKSELIDSPYDAIKNSAMDISSFSGISPDQRKNNKSNFFLSIDDNSIFRWVKGFSLTQDKPKWVPLQLVTFKEHASLSEKKEPRIRIPVSTGAASHRTKEKALTGGILELIERDAFMITWINKLTPHTIRPETINDEKLQKIFNDFARYGLDVHLLYLPSDFCVHTILAVICDPSGIGPAVCVGASTDFDIYTATKDALEEAHGTRIYTRRNLDTMKTQSGNIEYTNLHSIGREERLLYWAQPRMIEKIQFLLNGPSKTIDELPTYNYSPDKKLKYLIAQFKEKNYELSYVDILNPRLKEISDFSAVIVIAPELQPLHLEESVPYIWGNRLRDVPERLGYACPPHINTLPHPFP